MSTDFFAAPSHEHKRNFQVEATDGKKYWISRAVAVCAAVVSKLDGQWYILVNKRGEGCPDFNGMWNVPCGYLDWGETCKEACAREIWEECGLKVDPFMFYGFAVDSNPETANHQNVTIRHIALVSPEKMQEHLTSIHSEENEVSDIRWIKLGVDNDQYEWAFNHRRVLKAIEAHLILDEPSMGFY